MGVITSHNTGACHKGQVNEYNGNNRQSPRTMQDKVKSECVHVFCQSNRFKRSMCDDIYLCIFILCQASIVLCLQLKTEQDSNLNLNFKYPINYTYLTFKFKFVKLEKVTSV